MTDEKKTVETADRAAAITRDGFANLVQRAGYGAENSMTAGTYVPSELLTRNRIKLEWMYRQNWVAGTLVDAVAEDMTRAGIEITGGMQPEDIQEMQAHLTQMGVWDGLLDTIKWSRLFGGCLAIMQIAGQDTATPLNVETINVGQFQGLAVYDRWMVQPDLTSLIKSGPMIGLPEYYSIVTSYGPDGNAVAYGSKVHHSRVIRFIGIKLPIFQAMTEQFWGESVIERLYDRLLAFDTATMGAANLIDKAHLRRIGIDGLREILSMGGPAEENLLKMFTYVRQMQTNEGITLLDKEDVWETSTYSFSGLSDMMIQFNQQLAGSAAIPLVRLFGQSPAGLNSTGESDLRIYYDSINSQQESRMRTPMETLLHVVHRSLFGTSMPKDVQFKFAPLWQMSSTEKSTNAKTNTETILGAYDSGLVTAELALKELRQQSDETNIFSNITDMDIQEAAMAPPPVAPATPQEEAPIVGTESAQMSAFDKIKSWLGR